MTDAKNSIKEYSLKIRQQPRQGKAVGFKQYYGNFLDPTLILELKTPPKAETSEDESENCTSVIVSGNDGKDQVQQQMRGGRVMSPMRLIDPVDAKRKMFFVFPDLAIKTNGRFRLVARLINLKRSSSIIYTATTEPIHIYPARSYPGIRAPTALSESFSNQGALRLARLARNVKVGGNDDGSDSDSS